MMWLFLIVCVICVTIIVLVAMVHQDVRTPKKLTETTTDTTMAEGYEPPSINLN